MYLCKMTNQQIIDTMNQKRSGTLMETLDIQYTSMDKDILRGKMPVSPKHLQPAGILHGGASVAFAETLGSLASNLCIEENQATVGLDINANHISSVKTGLITGITSPIHVGRSTHVWEIKMYCDKKMICISRLTMAILTKS